jgi:hypothetical protein
VPKKNADLNEDKSNETEQDVKVEPGPLPSESSKKYAKWK